MAFEVLFKKTVQKDLAVLPKKDRQRVMEAIEHELAQDPFRGKSLAGEFKGLYRWRVGRFRVIYEIQKSALVILVLRVGHRKDVYG